MLDHDIRYNLMLFQHTISADYEAMESPEGLNRMAQALKNTDSDTSPTRIVVKTMSSFLENSIGIVAYGGILASLSPWILLTVSVTTIGSFLLMRQNSDWAYRNKGRWLGADRRLAYVRDRSADFSQAKDLRLYGMSGWLRSLFDQALTDRMGWHKKQQQVGFFTDGGQTLIAFVRESISYGGLIWAIYAKGMSSADFVLYFGVIEGLSNWLFQLARNLDQLYRSHLGFCEIREFLDLTPGDPAGEAPLPTAPFSIEFRHVSYRCAGNEEDTIHDLSFVIPKGEKLVIVGLNDAGKTTLVKLICGFYTPSAGSVFIGGTDIRQFGRKAYYKLFSAVFQEIFLLPVSAACNVSALPVEETDREKVQQVLEQAGLLEKIQSLPQGMDTRLIRSVQDDASDLSGGETQKLALARALYKNGLALLLDEPTAALDPLSEFEIYSHFDQIVGDKTAVYISHRLSSCRFCSDILVFDEGRLIQRGSHDQLVADRLGRYYELWHAQAQYYDTAAERKA